MKRIKILCIWLGIIFVLTFAAAKADAIVINVPGDYDQIQDAINAAMAGDTVMVAAGTYSVTNGQQFPIRIQTIGVSLIGSGAEDCILEAGNKQAVIICDGIDESTTIEGFAITHIISSDNSTVYGRGIECINASPIIQNNIISGNIAKWGGGGISCDGYSSPTITKNTITGNSSEHPGGGIHRFGGGGIVCRDYSNPTITENIITGNSTTNSEGGGGGILCADSSNPTIENNFIKENTTDSRGGGISCYYSSPMIASNVIAENNATLYGGGISCETSSPTIVNNTIIRNFASINYGGGGIFCWFSTSLITNNIITENNTTGYFEAGGIYCLLSSEMPTITYNTVYGNTPYDYVNCAPGFGSISLEPLLVDADNGDYHLQDGSPCIDLGDNSVVGLPEFDIEGNPRIFDGNGDGTPVVDMGAYEYQGITEPEEIIVNIDIEPWFRRNPFNPKSRGVLPVAVFGAEDFDVTKIDPETIRLTREGFEGVAPIRWRTLYMINFADEDSDNGHFFNWDSYLDLSLKFKTQDLVNALELEELGGEIVPLILTGQLKEEEGGNPIRGEDSIEVLNIRKFWKWWWWNWSWSARNNAGKCGNAQRSGKKGGK